jgi:hypothetical protein
MVIFDPLPAMCWQSGIASVRIYAPPPTIGGGDLRGVELPGDGVEACMAGRLDVPNYRRHVGRKLSRLRLTGHTHALHGAGSGRACPPGSSRRRILGRKITDCRPIKLVAAMSEQRQEPVVQKTG